jgi:hypothetical protein
MVAASCASSLQKFLFIVASMKRVGEFARGNGVEGSIAVGKVLPKTPEHLTGSTNMLVRWCSTVSTYRDDILHILLL